MFQQRLVWGVGGLLLLAFCPGCHLLVRLGEPAGQKSATETKADEFPRDITPPSSGPEIPPPLPGLDNGENLPPAPGLRERAGFRAEHEARRIAADSELLAQRSQPSRLSRSKLWAIRSQLSGNTGINTNTAIAPGEGQTVYRTQLRFLRSNSTPGPAASDINLLVNPHVLAYGVKENLTFFGVVPLVKRTGTVRPPASAGTFVEPDDFGVGDLRFFAKYRLRESDEPGETTRWSVFSGLEVPSYDKNFSSDSWDPFIGTVWTYQSLEWGLDLDWFWNFNTGNGVFRHDEMRYDLAYTYVLLIDQTLDEKFWQLNSIFELNGSYLTDGSNLLFAAPGLQLALERIIIEASLQLPVVRDLKNAIAPDFVLVIGTRITW